MLQVIRSELDRARSLWVGLASAEALSFDTAFSSMWFARIARAYNQSWRHLNTLEYINELILLACDAAWFEKVDSEFIEFAIWFSRFYYDPSQPKTYNLDMSAQFALQAANDFNLSQAEGTRIKNLILCLNNHQPENIEQAIMSDVSLAYYAAPYEAYLWHVADLRKEYIFVPDRAWQVKRTANICNFLWHRTKIYHAPRARLQEDTARANLRQELIELGT